MTRIIAGSAKGRRLAVPDSGTRPTSDRAREGLFNSLAATVRLDEARVLDLFAGTGAVGLEALSRGASTAVLVESNRKAIEVLRRNVDAVALPGAQPVHAPVNRFLADGPDEPFDLIFADPPYADAERHSMYVLMCAMGSWLARDGVVVIEAPARSALAAHAAGLPDLDLYQHKRYGETVLWYGRRR
jgi:16S rRNA (guanine966-N2)-methyltransferase